MKSLEEAMKVVKNQFKLTTREAEILAEIYHGKTNTQIGKTLFISESTVKAHVYSIFRKLGVNNRVEAVCIIREEQEKEV